jgi:hypothetical protein
MKDKEVRRWVEAALRDHHRPIDEVIRERDQLIAELMRRRFVLRHMRMFLCWAMAEKVGLAGVMNREEWRIYRNLSYRRKYSGHPERDCRALLFMQKNDDGRVSIRKLSCETNLALIGWAQPAFEPLAKHLHSDAGRDNGEAPDPHPGASSLRWRAACLGVFHSAMCADS